MKHYVKLPDGTEFGTEYHLEEVTNSFLRLIQRKNKKNAKNKIGVIVAISTENEDDKKRVTYDVISNLNNYINSKNISGWFKVISLDEKESVEIDNTNWKKTVDKYKGNLIIYGHVSKRRINGRFNYLFKLEAGVVHSPIPLFVSNLLSSEFSSIFPRERYFPVNDELQGFEITAERVGLAVEYMIAVAIYFSGNFGQSLKLFVELDNNLKSLIKTKDIDQIHILTKKVPLRITDVCLTVCDNLYNAYSLKRDKTFVKNAKVYLDLIDYYSPGNTRFKHFLSMYYFLIEKNNKSAIDVLKKVHDPLQQYNLGFLYFVDNQLNEGLRCYKRALKRTIPPKTVTDIECFMEETLISEPSKIQLLFSMGLINLRLKEDYILAKSDFTEFINKSKNNPKYTDLQRLSKSYIQEINKKPIFS